MLLSMKGMVIVMALNLGRLIDSFRAPKKYRLEKDALRNAGIGVLTQDERWNKLFVTIKKTPAIIKAEEEISNYLNEKTRLHVENKILLAEKQVKINRILELSQGGAPASESARAEVDACEARMLELNEREAQIGQRAADIDAKINESSLAMLEDVTAYLYNTMKKSQARIAELDAQIAKLRETLKEQISERETLSASVGDTYFFLHGLLGFNLIDPLDDHFTLDK